MAKTTLDNILYNELRNKNYSVEDLYKKIDEANAAIEKEKEATSELDKARSDAVTAILDYFMLLCPECKDSDENLKKLHKEFYNDLKDCEKFIKSRPNDDLFLNFIETVFK